MSSGLNASETKFREPALCGNQFPDGDAVLVLETSVFPTFNNLTWLEAGKKFN
jgi:hypothetical protein